MRRPAGFLIVMALFVGAALPAAAADAAAEIRCALERWTDDFNAGRSDTVCDLFAPDLRADYRGQPERDYDGLCDLLKRSLGDEDKAFSYGLDIKEILVFGDVAVVRLVWTLTIKNKDGGVATSVEPGMDIFRKQPDGRWRIVRYMAYER